MSVLSNELFFPVHRGVWNSYITDHKLDKNNLGVHWSADQKVAERFARADDKSWRTKHAVVLHGEAPMSSVEMSTTNLIRRGFAGHGSQDPLNEKEVQLKEGSKVKVTGMTKYRTTDRFTKTKTRTRRYNPPREMTV
jgi:hypothetical protein